MDNDLFIQEYAKYKNIAYKAANKYRRRLSPCEIKTAKYIGVWKALENFKSDKGMALSSYIFLRVKWECLRIINDNTGKIPIDHNKSFNIDTTTFNIIDDIPSNQDNKAIVKELMDSLSEKDRKLIDEYYFQNKDTVELGKEYGITAEGVRLRLLKILSKLRE